MKYLKSFSTILIAILITSLGFFNQVKASSNINFNTIDTVPKTKTNSINIDMSDFDRSIKELENAVGEMGKKVNEVDWNKMSKDLNNTLNKIDLTKIKADIKNSMKKVDWERVNGDVKRSLNDANIEIEKAMKEIDSQMNSEKMKSHKEELKKELEELKKDLKKNKEELQKESKSVTKSDY